MSDPDRRIANRVGALLNAAAALLVLLGVYAVVNQDRIPGGLAGFLATRVTIKNVLVTGVFLTACTAAFRVFGLTAATLATPFWKELVKVTKACTVAAVFAFLFPITSSSGAFAGRIVFYFLPVAIVACLCGRLLASACAGQLIRTLGGRRDVIIIGSDSRAVQLCEQAQEPHHGYTRVLGFVDSPNGHVVPTAIRQQMLGTLDDLEGILMRQPVDEVLIALPATSCHDQIQTAIRSCERVGVEAKVYLSDVFEFSLRKQTLEIHDETPVMRLKVVQDDYRMIVKRCIDVIGATVGLILFAPFMLVIAVAIRLTSPGPVVFTQERYGLRKRRFRMYKFRTMVPDAEKLQETLESRNEAQGPVFKIRHDPRITSIGRILRKTSLDELPQFFNVLTGEMSLVGPRPLPERDVSRFDKATLMRRFSVKPGLTCLWQVNGRSNTDFDRWIELDLKYIDTWSLELDLSILAQTIPAVLKGNGAA